MKDYGKDSSLKLFYNGELQIIDKETAITEMYASLDQFLLVIVDVLMQDGILELLNNAHIHARNTLIRNLEKSEFTIHDTDQLKKSIQNFHVQDSTILKYLISRSLMDVSVMIKIEDVYSEGSTKVGEYYYKVGVVDVQPKSLEKMEYYSQVERETAHLKMTRDCPIY